MYSHKINGLFVSLLTVKTISSLRFEIDLLWKVGQLHIETFHTHHTNITYTFSDILINLETANKIRINFVLFSSHQVSSQK